MSYITFRDENDNELRVGAHYEVCGTCRGNGSHVHRGIDGHGLTADDFAEDPDFGEAYYSGAYDVPCEECDGQRVVLVANEDDTNFSVYQEVQQAEYEYQAELAHARRYGY